MLNPCELEQYTNTAGMFGKMYSDSELLSKPQISEASFMLLENLSISSGALYKCIPESLSQNQTTKAYHLSLYHIKLLASMKDTALSLKSSLILLLVILLLSIS